MIFLPDTTLSHYVTMRIGGPAKVVVEIHSEQELLEAVAYATSNALKILVIGEGSNIVFGDAGFDGLVLINKISGLLIDKATGTVRIGAGMHWHDVVVQTVQAGLTGIEAMALIPGTSGATPINNVGAYGQDISGVLQTVHAYDMQTQQFVELTNVDCGFSYRNSIFKSGQYGRYIISSITLQLQTATSNYQPPLYPALQAELTKREMFYPTPDDVMQTVIAIRTLKLPDPQKLANAGSFFKNPIVSAEQVAQLLQQFPTMPHYPHTRNTEKLAAGWLIEEAGLKDYRDRGIWIYDKQALVLVNEHADSFADLQFMIDTITRAVAEKFSVVLQPEPEIFA